MAVQLDTFALRLPLFWVRLAQVVSAIVAFAVIAEYSGFLSRIDYQIACGSFSIVVTLAFWTAYLLQAGWGRGQVALGIDFVMWVLWLISAACMSDLLDSSRRRYHNSRVEAAVAFAWITWIAYGGSLVLDWLDIRRGVGTRVIGAKKAAAGGGGSASVGLAASDSLAGTTASA